MPMTNPYPARHAPRAFAPELTHHVFLIAIRGDPEEPVVHRGAPLHPMQVVLTAPGDFPPFAGHEPAIGPLPPLPPARRALAHARAPGALTPREVTGEILRDGQGRLYEKLGDYVRPVNQLFTGARGEMVDLAPMRDVTPRDADGGGGEGEGDDSIEPGAGDAEAREADDASGKPLREIARRLVPEPGAWRLVRYADFVDAIAPQLANPRRLQPGHQLPCYVQIHETAVAIALAALEEAAARELGHAGKLMPLSYDLCRRLAISLPRPPLGIAARTAKVPGRVPPGARFLTLRVALDPTAEAARPLPAAEAAATPAQNAAPAKAAIPEEFAKPWDLRLTRDEALYDMSLAASRGAWRRFLDRLKPGIAAHAMARWQALLRGKSAEEQLWAVRPPEGAIADARVRRWVDHTLQVGGYDVDKMRVEWEIHWRRKGL